MLRAVRCDIRCLRVVTAHLWLFPLTLTFAVATSFTRTAAWYGVALKTHFSLSFADLALLFYQGGMPYNPLSDRPFSAPAIWIAHQLFLCFLVCRISVFPRNSIEQLSLLSMQKRRCWWASKCIIVILQVSFTYLVQYCVLFTIAGKNELTFALSEGALAQIFGVPIAPNPASRWYIYVLFFPFLISAMLSVIQLFFSFLIGRLGSFIFMFLYLAFASFYDSPWFVGGMTMPIRGALCQPEATNHFGAILTLIALAVFAFAVGNTMIEKKDLY